MVEIKRKKFGVLVDNASLVALVLLSIFLGLANPRFFTLTNLSNILDLVSPLGITALAMGFVLMAGSIDLSVAGVAGLSGIVTSFLVKNLVNQNNFGFSALLVALLVGLSCGVLNGVLLYRFKIPSFMVTLGVGFITTGVGILLTRGNTIPITDWGFSQIGMGRIGPVPVAFLLTLSVFFVMWFLNGRTIFGRYVLAIFGDEAIARDLGISVNRTKIGIFGLAGALYGFAGAILTAKLGSGDINASLGLTFDSISSWVLGGIAITGGVGNAVKVLVDTFILTILRNGLILMGISPYVQQGVIGTILIFTVALTIDRKKIKIMK